MTAGPTGGLLASLAGQVFRVGQRAARSLPERRSAKFRRADSICWSKVADARKRPDWERPRYRPRNQGLPRPRGQGGVYPKQDAPGQSHTRRVRSGLQQVRADERKAVRCSRLGQHQRVLPLSSRAPLPLSLNSTGNSEATMKSAVKPNPVEEATIYLRGL